MRSYLLESHSSQETVDLGAALAKAAKPGDIFCLSGELGAGKTTLVKGLAKGLNIKRDKVNSPTFVLMNMYEGELPLYHFDLYRVDDIKEIANIGYDEFLYGRGVAIVEWAEKLKGLFPKECLKIELRHNGPESRLMHFSAQGKRYEDLLGKIKIIS